MAERHTFGSREPGVDYTERLAAYVVILNGDGQVAMVKGRQNYFLPGGGSLPNEAPEETIIREAREELALGVRPLRPIGAAVQYFYSSTNDRHYMMEAIFFTGEFTDEATGGTGEHELEWLPVAEAELVCFHACHAWAIRHA